MNGYIDQVRDLQLKVSGLEKLNDALTRRLKYIEKELAKKNEVPIIFKTIEGDDLK